MTYDAVELGTFLARPNRFLARVELGGREELCHIKNTSRLQELLLPGVRAAVRRTQNPARKTQFDLLAVEHGGIWVNIDSTAPNKVFGEWVRQSGHFGPPDLLRPETCYGASRFDWYIEASGRKIYAEVKGVTLVEDGVARFPGAPTLRGVKHLEELCRCLDEGYAAVAAFIIEREDVRKMGPNDAMQPAFGAALRAAAKKGVEILALNCTVTPDSIVARDRAEVLL